MPALNIKHDQAHKLASEIAKHTGQSITEVVLDALRDKHTSLQTTDPADTEKLLAYGTRFRATITDPKTSSNHDELYDETGLPR